MSDTVKIIIEIDKRAYKGCQKLRTNDDEGIVGLCAVNAIANGISLDDVKAGIEALPKTYPFVNHIDTYVKEDDVLQILDNIGKESEEKAK